MKKIQKIITSFLIVSLTIVLSGCGFRDNSPQYKVDLEVWGVFDDSDVYQGPIGEYLRMNSHVSIEYKKFNVETYKQDLLEAMAAGNGPDIFLIRNSWVPSFQDKIVAAPDILIDERSFRDAFVDVVADDFIGKDKKIYGMPLSVDSLGLYYNKDLFNAAGITTPPKTWDEFDADVALLNKVDSFGNIVQSGAALGTAYNINRSTDVLTAMMFQKGVSFTDKNASTYDVNFIGGAPAFEYYTQFANSASPFYSWNPRMHYSLDAFYEGTAAMMINYSWQYSTLKKKNAKLNIGVAPLPQFSLSSPVNYANYWGYAVSKNTSFGPEVTDVATQNKARTFEAWQFIKFMAFANNGKMTFYNALTNNAAEVPLANDFAKTYAEKTQKPAARRDLLDAQKNDVVLGPFAEGNIIAKNWSQVNPEAIETIFAEMIDIVNRGGATVSGAINVAQERVTRLAK